MTTPFRIYRGLEELNADDAGGAALTIGNFDGVHAGHREILRRVVELGNGRGWSSTVLTFDPHPARVLAPQRAPRLLSTIEQRAQWIREAGIGRLLILPFDRDLSLVAPREFVERILVGRLQARAVLVGANFRFGNRAAGDTALLGALGQELGFLTEIVPPVLRRGGTVSSSRIRALLEAGRVAAAARLLGRPYFVDGEVVPGRGVGSRQTVPTMNLATSAEVLPARGVYVTRTRELAGERCWQSVTNVGFRPTFGGETLAVETFALDGIEGDPPRRIRVEFLWRLREERRFPDAESLKAQILCDVARSQRWFSRCRRWVR